MKRLRKVPSVLFEFLLCFIIILYFQEFDSCLASAVKAEPAPVPKVLNFYALLAYQANYLYKRSNLCPKLTYEGVKTITKDSCKSGHNE